MLKVEPFLLVFAQQEILHHPRQSCYLHPRSLHLILRRARPAFFQEVMQDFRQWCKSKTNIKLGARGLMLEERPRRGRLRTNIAWFQPSCVRYGEDSQTRRLGSVGGPVSVQSTLSQRSVNAQSTLQSTLPKCWQAHDFCYEAEFRIKFQFVFNFEIFEVKTINLCACQYFLSVDCSVD